MRAKTNEMVRMASDCMVAAADLVRTDTFDLQSSGTHIDIIRHYNDLRLAMARIKLARDAMKELEDLLSKEIVPEALRSQGVRTVTVEDVGRVTVSHRFSCSMLDKDVGIVWLKDNGHGSLVQETVNSNTLSAFAKSLLEEAGKELPPEIFKVGTSPYTSITKIG